MHNGTVTTDAETVDSIGTLFFHIFWKHTHYKEDDFLFIVLPPNMGLGFPEMGQRPGSDGTLSCSINLPLTIKKCERITDTEVKFTFTSRSILGSKELAGSVGPFRAPNSARNVTGI